MTTIGTAIAVGLQIGTQPPLAAMRPFVLAARAMPLDSLMLIDHFQNVFPQAILNRVLSWYAAQRSSPHEIFDYQVLMGYLASRVGRIRLGVGVTEAIRRHPVLIAQAGVSPARAAPLRAVRVLRAGGADHAAVPEVVMTDGPLLWGTAKQVTAKLRAFGDAGLRHVVLAPVSGLVSKRAALYGLRATAQVARALR